MYTTIYSVLCIRISAVMYVYLRTGKNLFMYRCGSFSQKIEPAYTAQLAKRANPRYFILLCGISCELAGCVCRPIVDSSSMIAG
jgi:hypothetical protein